jgi:uncharacterized protein with PhoU and TrkA domain
VANNSWVAGKTLQELDTKNSSDVRVFALRRGIITILCPDIQIQAGDFLIVDATGQNFTSFERQVTKKRSQEKQVTGYGSLI